MDQLAADFSFSNIPARPEPLKVLLCSPQFFDVVDVKNVYMEGQEGKIGKETAIAQWNQLLKIYEGLKSEGILEEVHVIAGEPGLEDMVFCANQSFPWLSEKQEKQVVMSKMKHASREREVIYFENFFSEKGYVPIHLGKTEFFEGMGDCIPHPGKRLLYGGYGHRSGEGIYDEISRVLNVPVLTLELVNSHYYHLDTCFLPVDEETLIICKNAFSDLSIEKMKTCFRSILAVPEEEVQKTFSLNAHIIKTRDKKQKVAVIQNGAHFTCKILKENGFRVIETETGEFMKSGGSVFCMKMMFY